MLVIDKVYFFLFVLFNHIFKLQNNEITLWSKKNPLIIFSIKKDR